MDEQVIAPKSKRTYRPRKPFVGVVVTIGKKKIKCDSFLIEGGFLKLKIDTCVHFFSLANSPYFTIVDTRPKPVSGYTETTALEAFGRPGPRISGGPANARPPWRNGKDPRTLELEALSGPENFGDQS